MQVQCPGCQKTLNAPDHLAGKVVKCPGCGGQMQLPAMEPEMLEVLPAGPDAPPAGDRVEQSSGQRSVSSSSGANAGAAKRAPRPAPGVGGKKKCRFCGESILVTATKCRHCKSNLAGGAAKSMGRFRAREASSSGNKALILGVLSFFCAFGFILAPLAIIYGNSARKAGDGKGTAGMILGIIATAMWVLAVVGGILMGIAQGRG